MKLYIYSIYDDKSLSYGHPWFQPTEGMAIRMMTDLINDPDTQHYKHPNDYSLYCLGEYDTSDGIIIPAQHLKQIVTGRDVRRVVDQQQDLLNSEPVTAFDIKSGQKT